jgi:HD-GYP domain-containing protein (c-di-GMP phosphodiesterase class II)
MTADFHAQPPRLAELLGALSLATDSANGVPPETALRTAIVAAALGRAAGLDGQALHDAYLTGLLRFLGCTAYAHETAARYAAGDDRALMRAVMTADSASAPDLFRSVARGLAGASLPQRAAALARLATDPRPAEALARAHCQLATVLAARLGVSDGVVRALGELYERWDGRGSPHKLAAEAISPTARLVMVAVRVVSHDALEGRQAALEVVRDRSGQELDPRFAGVLLEHAPAILLANDGHSVWEQFLEAEPRPWAPLAANDATPLAEVFADYADLKSPFTLGHSRGVATLAANVAAAMDLAPAERTTLHAAALVHDLGRVAVANGIWDKPGPLTAIERERAESHARHTALVLGRTPLFAAVAAVAGQAHERSDGSGYPRGGGGGDLRLPSILAACDVFHALGEDRPHRPALLPAAAIALVADEARAGRLDRRVVAAMLSLTPGHASAPPLLPDGLSEREVAVLCLLARGLSNKEIGARLGISAKTVQHHVAHIYEKTAIRTRAAAAIYAVDQRLLTR